MFNRRDVLKLFGAGATIIPVIGGVADVSSSAKLIHTPDGEMVELVHATIVIDINCFALNSKCTISDTFTFGERTLA